MLTLSEKLTLLALHDEKGSFVYSASLSFPYGLAGAMLIELIEQERIALVDGKVKVRNPKSTGDTLLDETLQLIRASEKLRDSNYWVMRIASKIKKLPERIIDGLVAKNILERREQKILWVFPSKRYPMVDAQPEHEVRQHIRQIVLQQQKPEQTDITLLSLVRACGLINEVFSKEERKPAKKQIEKLTANEAVGKSVSDVVTAVTMVVVG